jgi:predicted ribosomally synthesized peptide with nif11-like leader
MSQGKASQFVETVSNDKSLQEKLKSASDPKSFIEIAEKSGYSFSMDELQIVIESAGGGALFDEELKTTSQSGDDASTGGDGTQFDTLF